MLIAISGAINLAFFFTFTTVMANMFDIYGFHISETSYMGSIYQFSGILFGIASSIYLTKYPTYKLA